MLFPDLYRPGPKGMPMLNGNTRAPFKAAHMGRSGARSTYALLLRATGNLKSGDLVWSFGFISS